MSRATSKIDEILEAIREKESQQSENETFDAYTEEMTKK